MDGSWGRMDRVQEIREREQKATKGPWEEIPLPFGKTVLSKVSPQTVLIHVDAEFIANARQDIPYLLRRLELAEAVIRKNEMVLKVVDGTSMIAWDSFCRGGGAK